MRRAARTDGNHAAVVGALRQCGASVLSLAAIGHGVPDLLVFHPVCGYLLVEVKDSSKPPSKRRLTPDQEEFHSQWRGRIAIVETVEQAIALIVDVPENAR